jgi:TonB-linked SusC/RagA family outer membrane protein
MKQKLLIFFLFAAFSLQSAFAQNRKITGTVTGADDGQPLPGVSVQVAGTKIGTQTDPQGLYSINIPGDARSLTFTYIGYASKTIQIGSSSTINLTLASSNKALNEVVVTAYGSTKKQAFTGTASTVGNEKFKDLQVSSIGNVLQGQASGVLVVNSTGQPGENPTIRIRGVGSVNASADPFIVLDGSPYGGNISSINPNDIQSITVLKDANSTALYGSRAANGVLLITTKTGVGAPKVNISAITGFSNRAVKDYDYVSSQQQYELTWEALQNQALITPSLVTSSKSASAADYASRTLVPTLVYNPYNVAQPVGLDGKLVSGLTPLWNENWAKDLLRTGVRKDYEGSISGSSDKTKYFVSGGFLDDAGLPLQSDYKRYNGRVKLDNKMNKWLDVGVNASGSYSTQNYPAQSGSAYSNILQWIRSVSSIYPQYLLNYNNGSYLLDANGNKQYDFGNNGSLIRPVFNPGNPGATTSLNPTTYNRFITSLNGYAEAQIFEGLKFRTQYAIDYYQTAFNQYYNPFVGDGAAYGGRSEKSRETSSTQTFTNTLTYDKTFNTLHHLNALVGMEAYRYNANIVDAESRGFSFPGVTELSYGSTPYTATSYAYDNRLLSYFGRLNYDYADKYHISGSLRTDGSTRFAENVRYGVFYSVGGAWNINKESFLADVSTINDLKLRVSYGTTGNQAFYNTATGQASTGGQLYFPYLGGYTSGANIAGYSGSYISSAANYALTWEKQKTLDIGIDYELLKSRISGSFTFFDRKSEKLLFNRPLAPSSGLTGVSDNVGAVRNRGIEIDLTGVSIRKKDFQWTTSVNATWIQNQITELPSASITGTNYTNLVVGQPLYNFYIREYAGVDPADGRPMWYIDQPNATTGAVTKTTTKTWSAATRYYEGTSLPNWTGGMTNNFRYKNFDLNILIAASFGGKILDTDYAGLMHSAVGNSPGYNWSTDILNRWQSTSNPGDGITPRLTTTTDDQGNSVSTRFLYSASYGRVRNLTLGYHLPQQWLNKIKFSNARVFVDYQNPLTFFGRKGLDPEEGGIQGVTNNTSVIYKTLSFGVNFGF